MAIQPRQTQEHFRQTGKFKPISDHQLSPQHSALKFIIQSFQRLPANTSISLPKDSKLWRMYLDQTTYISSQESLKQIIKGAFEYLERSQNLNDSGELFVNVGGVLIEKLRDKEERFSLSQLDYNCAIVRLIQVAEDSLLDVYVYQGRASADRDFTEEISIKLRQQPDPYYLVQRSKMLYIVKNTVKNYPILELTDQNLDQTSAEVEKQVLLVKNLSARIIAVKFQEENVSKSHQPLLILMKSKEIYNLILYKINRIKYQRYRIQDSDTKQWHSFDNICQQPHKKQNKTTPDKTKTKPNKISILSTNAVEDSKQSQNKKKLPLVGQPRPLKISQRVATNPKESNLVPSEVDYAVSVKDEKEKDNPYFDQFQNLLYEQSGGGEDKQLTLNDSFQQFQKKQHSEKNLQIIKELNKRKQKETQEKRMLDSLKQKLKDVMNEEKEWINKNLKLKSDIKRLKNPETTEQNKEIDQIKMKIGQLKLQEKILLEELAEIKKNNSIEAIAFCEGAQDSSQSQRGKQKIFHSINNLPLQPNSFNPISTSVRSNGATSKFPQPTIKLQMPPSEGSPNLQSPAYKQNFKTNFPIAQNPPVNPINIYSSIPSPNLLQQNYIPLNQRNNPSSLLGSVGHGQFPRAGMHNHQGSVPFTSAIFPSARIGMGSPLGAKKSSFQVFPTANNNKN